MHRMWGGEPAGLASAPTSAQSLQCVGFIDRRWRNPSFLTGGPRPPVAFGDMAMECGETVHVLQTVRMACPYQACSLQGSRDVSCDSLAANDLGTGSGW